MSPVSSGVTIHGPKAPERSKFLPGQYCGVWFWKSRIDPSLKQAYPATWPQASAGAIWRPGLPMITASSPSESNFVLA